LPLIAGHRLQIVPVAKDIPQEMGKIFNVKVYFDGKPLAGVTIMPDFVNDPDGPVIKTDAEGLASFRLRNQGLNVICATLIEQSAEPRKFDFTEYRATLSFILPHAAE
jgi:uncharacterized GH25 family protein